MGGVAQHALTRRPDVGGNFSVIIHHDVMPNAQNASSGFALRTYQFDEFHFHTAIIADYILKRVFS
jgi:hypothetical protein